MSCYVYKRLEVASTNNTYRGFMFKRTGQESDFMHFKMLLTYITLTPSVPSE